MEKRVTVYKGLPSKLLQMAASPFAKGGASVRYTIQTDDENQLTTNESTF